MLPSLRSLEGQTQTARASTSEHVLKCHSIDGHRVDPFDALPIRTDTSVDQLARWHFQCCNPYEPYPRVQKRIPWMQMCTAFWSRSLWEIGLKDPTLFQAVLCVAQAKFALLSGRQDNAQYYIIKGRVVSTVRDRVMSQLSPVSATELDD